MGEAFDTLVHALREDAALRGRTLSETGARELARALLRLAELGALAGPDLRPLAPVAGPVVGRSPAEGPRDGADAGRMPPGRTGLGSSADLVAGRGGTP